MCRSHLSNARQSYQLPQPAYPLKPAILQAASHKGNYRAGIMEAQIRIGERYSYHVNVSVRSRPPGNRGSHAGPAIVSLLFGGAPHHAARTSAAAAIVCSTCSLAWASDGNHASNGEGGT